MRRLGRATFVVFYIAASIAVTGYRSAWMAERVVHAAKPSQIELTAPPQVYVKAPFPYFAHARKIKSLGAEIPAPVLWIPQFTIQRLEERPTLSLLAQLHIDWVGTRAPPLT